MPQPLFHALGGLALPDLHIDAQGRNFNGADVAVLIGHALHAGVGGLLVGGGGGERGDGGIGDRGGAAGAGSLNQHRNGAAAPGHAVAAPARSHSLLEAGEDGALHHAGHGGALDAVLQLGHLVVHHIFPAVVVLGAVDILIAGAAVEVLGGVRGKGVVRREGRDCQGQRRRKGQHQTHDFSDMLQVASSISSIWLSKGNSCQSPGLSRRTIYRCAPQG